MTMGMILALRRRPLSSLRTDERGTSVIELAIVAPVLAFLTMGIVDLSTGYGRRMEITEAVNRTIEKVAAKNFEVPGTAVAPDFTYIKNDAAEAAGVDPDAVTVTRWLECDGEEQDDFNGTCPMDPTRSECQVESPDPALGCAPVIARYLQVRIDTSFKPSFATILAPRPDGTYPLFAEAAVRIQ
jgi:hypothetical protein